MEAPPVHNTGLPVGLQESLGEKQANTVLGGIPRLYKPTVAPWSLTSDVLALSTFPSTTTLRMKGRNRASLGTCSCVEGETHRDFFGFCRQIIHPSMRDDRPIPQVKVCWNAENLFECKLNRELSGLNNRLFFRDLPTVGAANKVLFEGTYWFARLMTGKPGSGTKHTRNGIAILRLLAGLPSYSGKHRVDQLCKMKLNGQAVNKLRSILATVDGLLMQLTLCFPDREEYLNWSRIDQITNCMVSLLTADYFRDREADLTRSSTYEKVKRLRKAIKLEGFRNTGDLDKIDVPRELSFFERALSFVGDRKRPIDIYRVATLCQTRACGVPPRSVYLKTLKEIKEVLVERPDPSVYEGVKALIRPCVESIHYKVLDRLGSETRIEKFWSKCLDKAKISLSDSGEFFTNSESGGKLEAARLVLSCNEIDKYDLFTGRIIGRFDKSTTRQGELLFHWALGQFADRRTCYQRNVMSVRISLVAELGKYRAITVSHLAHAVLLHVLSHVMLEYLKAIPSSESGVGAANHAWNFFKRLSHKNPRANFLFGNEEVYLFSTDWTQATNYCDHRISQATLNCWAKTLGIPQWYRETCCFALCAPRQVEFIDERSKTLESFYTSRGELMGDPVVKGILHYIHLVARESVMISIQEIKSCYASGKLAI